MSRSGKRFRNQSKEQTLKHLSHLMKESTHYNISVDPLRIYFELRESSRRPKPKSEKLERLREETKHLSRKKRRLVGTKKRIRPKIRSVKKGRTVNLKGVTY